MIEVRPMRPDEAQAASDIMCACYRDICAKHGYNAEQSAHLARRGSVESIRTELDSRTFLVACNGSRIVGAAALHDNELTRLFVKPGLQGKGIGSRLLLAAEETASANGFDEITVRVLFSDAVGFYERHGFRAFAGETKSEGAFKGFEVKLLKKELV